MAYHPPRGNNSEIKKNTYVIFFPETQDHFNLTCQRVFLSKEGTQVHFLLNQSECKFMSMFMYDESFLNYVYREKNNAAKVSNVTHCPLSP